MYRRFLTILTVFLVVLLLFSVVTSENEAELEILKNYAISNYGLDPNSIETIDFFCWTRDAPEYQPKVCDAAFKDSEGKYVALWVNLDANPKQFFDHKPSFHELHPDVSPKIDRGLYYEMINASPDEEIPIKVTKRSPITDAEREELEQLGMNVTLIEDKPERWLQLTGYMSIAFGNATPIEINKIADLSWVYGIFKTRYPVSLHEMPGEGATQILSALIVSNSVDMPTAVRLKEVFDGFDITSKIINASDSEFQNPEQEYYYAIRFILGGPKAYEGVGNLSAQYLSDEDEDYLINTTGAYGFWNKQGVIGRYTKKIIIIAGHTRNETVLAEMEFESKGLNEEGWLVV